VKPFINGLITGIAVGIVATFCLAKKKSTRLYVTVVGNVIATNTQYAAISIDRGDAELWLDVKGIVDTRSRNALMLTNPPPFSNASPREVWLKSDHLYNPDFYETNSDGELIERTK